MTLFDTENSDQIINVASVTQLSPFRYPGGKTWLVPRVRTWLRSLDKRPVLFIEPFAGGGIISLTVANEKLADHVLMVELDQQVAAVWQTILEGNAEWLAERILNFDLTISNVKKELDTKPQNTREEAFKTILKNRTFHGGIMAPGSGLIKNGENGKGIKSRWYPQTLAKRIRAIEKLRDCLTFICHDGISVIQEKAYIENTAFFIDPPYTAGGINSKRAGKRLYTHNVIDHDLLFSSAQKVKGSLLFTYEDSTDILDLAKQYSFYAKRVAMKNTHHAKMTELLISRNLDWLK